MKLEDAIDLIKHDIGTGRQTWVDLGAGTGTFTLALSNILSEGSIIYAVDKDLSSLEKIPSPDNQTIIKKLHKNFVDEEMPRGLDGIFMGNSFHFVKNKSSFIKKSEIYLKDSGSFLIVEYNTNFPTPWVPFPISFNSLNHLFKKEGYASVKKLNERPSAYRIAKMYSALIRK